MKRKVKHEYQDCVDKDNIYINRNNEYRYTLSIPLINGYKRSVLVIMKNPSKADGENSDHTINNVIKFCNNQYNKVYIMNLFPYYSTDPVGIKEFISSDRFAEIMRHNIILLEKLLCDVDDIIVAWGGNSIGNKKEYQKAINKVTQIIKGSNKKVYAVRKRYCNKDRKYPWHAQVWAVNHDLEKYEW